MAEYLDQRTLSVRLGYGADTLRKLRSRYRNTEFAFPAPDLSGKGWALWEETRLPELLEWKVRYTAAHDRTKPKG